MMSSSQAEMEEARDYQVNLEIFQGPLDLLLFLIRKKKIDIHDIPMATITGEYLAYLHQKEKINLEREGEFLVIASLLIYIKSQMLIPRESELEDEEDPRRILVDRLLDFQKIKAASNLLREKEEQQTKIWKRSTPPPRPSMEEMELAELSLFDLAEAFLELMKKKERENIHLIQGKEYSLEEKMKELIERLREQGYLDFLDYFNAQESIEEALISFFCLLELIKARIVVAVQESLFHPIKVWPTQGTQS
jgi:segregation and condensation protein A